MSISEAPSAVQGIFALDIVTASLAFICLVVGILLTVRAFGLRSRTRNYDRVSRDTPRHTPLGTFAFLLPGLALLCLAYSVAAATTTLQYDASSPINITPAYAYSYPSASESSQASTVTSRLSFVNAFALILYSTLLTAAVWLHSSHVTSNGLGVGAPSLRDWIWNMFILAAILGTGLASWGQAISVRDSAQGYSSVMQADSTSRALYAAFRCTVIAASTSVSVEVARRYREVNANGPPSVSHSPIGSRSDCAKLISELRKTHPGSTRFLRSPDLGVAKRVPHRGRRDGLHECGELVDRNAASYRLPLDHIRPDSRPCHFCNCNLGCLDHG